ncbi:MAG: hypothetical protein AAGI66_07320 [Cyanobacteria bacterium P01_H01_bin.74]
MSLATHAAKNYQIRYLRVYLAPRTVNNTYDIFIDISNYVIEGKLGKYKRSIDSDPFSIGFYEESNIKLSFDNADQLFSSGRGYFENKIVDRSKIRVVAGYYDIHNIKNVEFENTFEGIIEDRSTTLDDATDTINFTILSYSGVIGKLVTDPGAVTNGQDFKTALWNLLNRNEVKSLLTLDSRNINPNINLTIDDATFFVGKQLKTALNALLLASNSVLKIENNTLYIADRSPSLSVRFQFFGSRNLVNIYKLENYTNGLSRSITRVAINTKIFESDNAIINQFGANLKSYELNFITDDTAIKSIGESILEEFAYPKPELNLTTDFIGNEIQLLDLVTIDYQGTLLDKNPALYGQARYAFSQFVKRSGAIRIDGLTGFKVLGIEHDFQKYTTKLKLRQVGTGQFDSLISYNTAIYGQGIYDVSTYAQTA